MPPPKRKSETSPDMKFAVQKLAKKWHGSIGKNRNVKFTSTPTTKVAKGRGTSTGRKSRSVRPPRPYYWETSDKGGLPRKSSVGGSRSN